MPPKRCAAALLLALAALFPSSAHSASPALHDEREPHVLLLGMFHFQDAGLDGYKPRFTFDVREPGRQREVERVVSQLAAWKPTRVLVEAPLSRQARLDSLYALYPDGGLDTLRNETYQIGFRLAKRLGLPGVIACDAPARFLDADMSDAEYERRVAALGSTLASATDWDARFTRMYTRDDSLKAIAPLATTLRYVNSEARLRAGHGHYLVGALLRGDPGDYLGADGFVSGWYTRNLRIYSNIVRSLRSPDERVVVLFGAGHVPILRELFLATPVARLDEVRDVVR